MIKSTITPRHKLLMMGFDLLLFICSFFAVIVIRFSDFSLNFVNAFGFWFMAAVLLVTSYILGVYDMEATKKKEVFIRNFLSVLGALASVLVVNYLFGKERAGIFGRGVLVGAFSFFWLMSSSYRYMIWLHFQKVLTQLNYLFLCHDNNLAMLKSEFLTKTQSRSEVFLPKINKDVVVLESLLRDKLKCAWTAVILAVPQKYWSDEFSDLLMQVRFQGTQIISVSDFLENQLQKIPVDFLNQEWFIFEKGFTLINNPIGLRVKRLADLMLALILLSLTWPLILVAAILIKLESPGEVFYRQVRTGLNDQDFTIFKLRSMKKNAEMNGAQWASQGDTRVTLVGKWIRLTRIDELPQLWNVIRGDMSFIGPRPERPEFNVDLEKKIPFYRLRHMVRPGITGWAQVMYPYGASVEDSKQKLQFDMYYIKNFSFLLDFIIVLKTIRVVIFGKGR
ncbi:MAG: exopolysaccharide biosynthesis polyprenyl glycosylphosphotransferase [Bdellovibrionaceae bacterium]|nr:exopolysaccharide biosynthesis polyprenyl glycosylphosphotransferase [Pseudobdellovibrionaceae bacterium]